MSLLRWVMGRVPGASAVASHRPRDAILVLSRLASLAPALSSGRSRSFPPARPPWCVRRWYHLAGASAAAKAGVIDVPRGGGGGVRYRCKSSGASDSGLTRPGAVSGDGVGNERSAPDVSPDRRPDPHPRIMDGDSGKDLSLDYGPNPTIPQKLVQRASKTLRSYLQLMRLDRPIGSWLLFWPCGWSIALAAAPGCPPDLGLLALFACGAVVMRGAGCTINDMWDREYDGKVARTAARPLASGALSMLDAFVCLGTQLSLGCLILLQLNWYAVLLGTSSLGLIVLYPLMKRVTYWPQLMLGFTFNWGALLGWAAVHGTCEWTVCVPLYISGIAWTLIYDTIYAHQDKYDDAIIGIKSTALKFGDSTWKWLTGFGVTMISSLILTGHNTQLAWPYYLAVSATAVHITKQIWTLDINNPVDCGQKFRANRHIGLLLFAGIIGGTALKMGRSSLGSKEDSQRSVDGDQLTTDSL